MKHKAFAVLMALAVMLAFGGCWSDPDGGSDNGSGGDKAAETQPQQQSEAETQATEQPTDTTKIVFDIPEGWERDAEDRAMARPIITLADIPAEVEDKAAEVERWKEIVPYSVGVDQYDPGNDADFQKVVDEVINYLGGKDKINQPPDEGGYYATMEDIEIAGYKAVLFQSFPIDDIMYGGTDLVFMKDGNVGWLSAYGSYDAAKTTIDNIIKTIRRE